MRTENDLRAMYADQPDAVQLERRLISWLDLPRPVAKSTRASWVKAGVAAAAVAALTAGVVLLLPRGADYPLGAAAGASATVSAAMPAESTALAPFSFTQHGKLIPAGTRELAGPVTGPLLGGGQYSLTADAGHIVVLNFFATWCGPCQTESPAFEALSRQRAASGVKFVGIDVKDGSLLSSRAWLAEKGITFPIVWDQPGNLAAPLGKLPIVRVPLTVLLDPQRRIAAVYGGMVTTVDLASAIDQLSAEAAHPA